MWHRSSYFAPALTVPTLTTDSVNATGCSSLLTQWDAPVADHVNVSTPQYTTGQQHTHLILPDYRIMNDTIRNDINAIVRKIKIVLL